MKKTGMLLMKVLGVVLLSVMITSVSFSDASAVTVFSTDFNSGIGPEFSGPNSAVSVEGFSVFADFDGNLLWNSSDMVHTVLSLSGLPIHDSVDINFVLAIIDSWDGTSFGCCNPDFFNVSVDGTTIFSETFTNVGKNASYSAPGGVTISPPSTFELFGPFWRDSAFNMGLDSTFDGIVHTSSTLKIDFWASGAGWQGGLDESFGLENVSIELNGSVAPVPEPSTMILMSTGLVGLFGYNWRKRKNTVK